MTKDISEAGRHVRNAAFAASTMDFVDHINEVSKHPAYSQAEFDQTSEYIQGVIDKLNDFGFLLVPVLPIEEVAGRVDQFLISQREKFGIEYPTDKSKLD